MMFTKKNKEGVRAIWAMKYQKFVAGTCTRARAPLARKYTDRIFESKDGTTSMKIVNYTVLSSTSDSTDNLNFIYVNLNIRVGFAS